MGLKNIAALQSLAFVTASPGGAEGITPPHLAQILITAHEDSAGMDVKFFSPSQMLSLQSRVGESRLYGTVCRMLCTTIFLRYYRDELSGAAILTLSLWAKFSQSASFPLKWI